MTIDRRMLLPAAVQALSLGAPFIFLRTAVAEFGAESAVATELALSIAAFFAIVVDWSSTTFLSRVQARMLLSGGYFSVLAAKFAVGVLLFGLTVLLVSWVDPWQGTNLVWVMALMLAGTALDPSWIHVGRGAVWAPAALGAARFLAATGLALALGNPMLALGVAYLLGSAIFLLPLLRQLRWPGRISLRLPQRIIARYLVPTATDLLTASFSRLDVALAAALLPVDQALIYAVARKLIIGLQSVAFSSARLFYLERDEVSLDKLRRSLRTGSAWIFTLGLPAAYGTATYLFLLPSTLELALTLGGLGLLLPLGYLKTLSQFSFLYRSGLYRADLSYSVAALATFVLGCGAIAAIAAPSAVVFALVRVGADVTYVALAKARWGASHA